MLLGVEPASGRPRTTALRPLALALALSFCVTAVGCATGDDASAGKDRGDGGAVNSNAENAGNRSAQEYTEGAPEEERNIPGMNADDTMTVLQKPGLECWQAADEEVLYACSGDEETDLLYEATISGSAADRVSYVEVRIYSRETGNFDLASQPFLGFLGTQLRYEGSDRDLAHEFVNSNLGSAKATTTIGTARWTMTSSGDAKTLAVSPK